jgi:hypothetical protein
MDDRFDPVPEDEEKSTNSQESENDEKEAT